MATGEGQSRPAREMNFTALGKAGRKTGYIVPDNGQRDTHGFELIENFFSPSSSFQKTPSTVPGLELANSVNPTSGVQALASQALQLQSSSSAAPLNGFSVSDSVPLFSDADAGSAMELDSGSGPELATILNQRRAPITDMTVNNTRRPAIPRARSPFKTNPFSDVQNTPPKRASSAGLGTSAVREGGWTEGKSNPLRSSPIRSPVRRAQSHDGRGNINVNRRLDFGVRKSGELVTKDGDGREGESPLLKQPKRIGSNLGGNGPNDDMAFSPLLRENVLDSGEGTNSQETNEMNVGNIQGGRATSRASTVRLAGPEKLLRSQPLSNDPLSTTQYPLSASTITTNGIKPVFKPKSSKPSSKQALSSSPPPSQQPSRIQQPKKKSLGSLAAAQQQRKITKPAASKTKTNKPFSLSNLTEYYDDLDVDLDLDLDGLDREFGDLERSKENEEDKAEEERGKANNGERESEEEEGEEGREEGEDEDEDEDKDEESRARETEIGVEKPGNALGVDSTKDKNRAGTTSSKTKTKGKTRWAEYEPRPEPEPNKDGKNKQQREQLAQVDHEVEREQNAPVNEVEKEKRPVASSSNAKIKNPQYIASKAKDTVSGSTTAAPGVKETATAKIGPVPASAQLPAATGKTGQGNRNDSHATESESEGAQEGKANEEECVEEASEPDPEFHQPKKTALKRSKKSTHLRKSPAKPRKSTVQAKKSDTGARSPASRVTKAITKARGGARGKKVLNLTSEDEAEEENEVLEVDLDEGERVEGVAIKEKGKARALKLTTIGRKQTAAQKNPAIKEGTALAGRGQGDRDKMTSRPDPIEEVQHDVEVEEEEAEQTLRLNKGKRKSKTGVTVATSPSLKSKIDQQDKETTALPQDTGGKVIKKHAAATTGKKTKSGKKTIDPILAPDHEKEPASVVAGASSQSGPKVRASGGGWKTNTHPHLPVESTHVASPAVPTITGKHSRRGGTAKAKSRQANEDVEMIDTTQQQTNAEGGAAEEREGPPRKKARKGKHATVPTTSEQVSKKSRKPPKSKRRNPTNVANGVGLAVSASQAAAEPTATSARQIIRIERPIPPPVAVEDDGKRRSQRTRIQPLKWWAGERVTYGKATKRDSIPGVMLPEIKEIVKVNEVIQPLKNSKRSTTAQTKKAGSGEKRKRYESEAEGEGDEIEDEPEDWEENGRLRGLLKPRDPLDDDELEEYDLAYSQSRLRTNEVANASFKMCKTYSMQHFGTGFIDLPPGGSKRMKSSGKYDLVFLVLSGKVRVEIGTNQFKIRKGCQFQVPKGNLYCIENAYDAPSSIFFAQGCEVSSSS